MAGGGIDNTAAQPNVYTGALLKVISGPPFNAVPFDFAAIKFQAEGTLTVTFRDGNFATLATPSMELRRPNRSRGTCSRYPVRCASSGRA